MDDPFFMGIGEAAGRLRDDGGGRYLVAGAVLEHLPPHVEALDIFGDEVIHLAVAAGVEGPQQVIVVKVTEPLDLAQKRGLGRGVRLVLGEHLHGDDPPHHRVPCLEYPPHAPLPHLVENAVLSERQLAAAEEQLLGLKLRQQFAADEDVGHGLVPGSGAAGGFAENRAGGRFGFIDRRRSEKTAGYQRRAKAAPW